MCAVGRLGWGLEVVGFGVGAGGCAVAGHEGDRGTGDGGLAAAIAQNGQSCLLVIGWLQELR